MPFYKCVILGGGLAAGYAAQAAAEAGVEPGELGIVSAEATLPYERPPLSKDFLAGDKTAAEILINEPSFYEENNIDVHLETVVGRVDLQHKQLYTNDEPITYEKLLIATGARPHKFDLPGSNLEGLFYLREIGDAQHIRAAAEDAFRAVVIGGSFIGMEVASVLQQSGVDTTMVFPGEHVWESFFTPRMSTFFETYYQERGVEFVTGTKAASFKGENGRISHVVLQTGQELPADLVVAGIGVIPNTELFANSSVHADTALQIEDGIVVNRFLETNVPDVFAAGDVARYADPIFGKTRRIEHWDNAVAQGQHAMRAMMGKRELFAHVPYFFSDVFDLSYEFWGDTAAADQVVHRGDVEDGQFSAWWLKDGRLHATFVMDRPDEERELAPQWIKSGQPLAAERLQDSEQSLRGAATT